MRWHLSGDAKPQHVVLGPLAVVVLVVVVVVLIVHAVAVVVVPVLALPEAIRIGAVIVLHVVVVHLPLRAIVGQCEWGWWLLAWSVEVEHAVAHVAPSAIIVLSHEVGSDVCVAGGIVRLEVELDGLVLSSGCELVTFIVPLALPHVGAILSFDVNGVVLSYL